MLSEKITKVLNKQIQAELYASNLYLAMSAYADAQNLPGFARWMRLQSEEERGHALRIFDYLGDREARIEIGEVKQPPAKFGSPLEMFEAALEHERKVTSDINQAYELASHEHDHATMVHLQWFISEQVEEERTASEITARLRMAGTDLPSLLLIDQELADRQAA